ncbi:MAG: IPT/TIG domain-containing protein [Prevotella sp.]|nr:IPT/TIG domain-containing protein [Prevotella sp.]
MITKISRRLLIGLSFIICHLSFSMMFTSCAEDDDNGPANIGLGIKVFFPTKVVTNQPVTINGSGFTDVTEIEFPGGAKAASFEIVSDDMIRVVTPSGVAADGGKILVRTASGQAESRLPLTVGHTQVSGFSKQPGETASGGEQITVFGSDLEFITGVELLNADSVPQVIDHKDFYRKGTSTFIFSVPQKDIYKGTFTGVLHTYDGQRILMPELAYEPAADEGHWETVKTTVWKNDGSLGEINWSSDYRFAPASNSTGEECYTVPQDVWERLKTETFYVTIKGASPQIRVTSGWWSTTWTGDDIFPGNELLTDNGDGTFTLTVSLAGDPLLDVLDAQHLLFTGGGYTVDEIYFAEEIWVPGGGGEQEVKVPVWENGGTLGEINWSGDYRFAPASNSTGEECYIVPQDVWERLKTETFYVTIKGASPQIRVTSGWWSTTWTGDDIFPGNERLADNGDGTFTLTVNLAGDPLLDVLDAQHLLFTGSGYTVEEIYFIEIVSGGGGNKPSEVVIWQGDGSAGAVSWSGTYRFANAEHVTGEEIYAIPMDQWEVIRTSTFYLDLQAEDPQIRVTTGWWSTTWTGADFQPGTSDLLKNNGDGTWTLEINFSGDPILDALDVEHLLFTGDRFTPTKLYYYE